MPVAEPAPALFRSRPEVIFIGPVRAGKSTLARLLAARLGLPHISLDALRFAYYRELGYDEAAAQRLRQREGFLRLYRFWKPFELHGVERLLADYRDCVFDFGAGHSVYDEPAQVARLQQALAPFRHVVLVLPSPDVATAVRILRERIGPWLPDGTPYFDFETYFVQHPSNRALATVTVYTEGQTPEQTCAVLVEQLGLTGGAAAR